MLGSHQDTVRTPDLVEEIIGWRGWNICLSADDSPPYFTSPHISAGWLNGELIWDGECRCERSRTPWREASAAKLETAIEKVKAEARELDGMRRPFWTEDDCAWQSDMKRVLEVKHDELSRQLHEHMTWVATTLACPCHCGINAFATCEQLMDSSYRDNCYVKALGSVALSGEVRGYERGWRAERAQVVSVWAREAAYAHLVERACAEAGIEYLGVIDLPPIDYSVAAQ